MCLSELMEYFLFPSIFHHLIINSPPRPTTGGWRLEVGDLIHYNVINYNPTPLPYSSL